MIFIFCREFESSIVKVVDWLHFYNIEYKIFTNNSKINIHIEFIENKEKIFINNMDVDEVKTIFYRNGEILSGIKINVNNSNLNQGLNKFIEQEWLILRDYLFSYLKEKKHVGNYELRVLNKLTQLSLAVQSGLKIPNTVIGGCKKSFTKLKKNNKITKPVSEIFHFSDGEYNYSSYVKRLDDRKIENKAEEFFPSLVQEEVDKKYELRIFFLNNLIYPMAIFSSDDKVDVREADVDKQKRFVPYKLDKEIEKKVKRLIQLTELQTGSIDMIVTHKKEYYFLEVNPSGQYEYLSYYCNYNLSKKIAEELL
ncbi:MAG: grasp-with-spasm system ATP-grasp peptide maturase [Candidatus Izemoplasmatales bacterium]